MSWSPPRVPRDVAASCSRRRTSRFGQRRDGRLDGRQREREEIPLQAGGRRGVRGGLDGVGGQAVELGAVGHVHGQVVGLGEHPVGELRGQRGDLHVEVAQRVAVGFRQRGARAHEVAVVALDDAHLLRRQAGVVAGRVHGVDAREQPRVEPDRVGVLRDQRRQLGLQGLHLRRRHRGAEVRPDAHHPLVGLSGPLQRLDGVRERRLVGLRGDRVDLGALLGDTGVEGGAVVLVPDHVEGWERERQVAGDGEGVALGHSDCSTPRRPHRPR